MSDRYVFDPRDERCKAPFGAVPCGTEVSFTLRPLAREGFCACTLLVEQDFSGRTEEIPLPPVGDGGDLFSGTYTAPETPELLWYGFRFTRMDGSFVCFGKGGYCAEGQLPRWQITVYDGAFTTPAWFGEGVTYQIFPDRFCRLSVPDPAGMIGERTVHQRWEEPPEHRPNGQGKITCSDFFGGSLAGIRSKLDYLQSLSVTTLYLCPVFESDSNHRYNTADYLRIDPMLGTEEDLRLLCREAHERGIRVMLDGVFNHTGSTSRYFNATGEYPQLGAAQSPLSPYYSWYQFRHWPDDYESWWGIQTMPAANENDPGYRAFIVTGEDSVVRHWLRIGADAWRLDVADELPDDFIADIRRVMTEEKPDSFLLGEVWEDGSNKIAYSRRRRYLLGGETNGLMNYPFRTAALRYLTGGDAAAFRDAMEDIRENYPPAAFHSALNFLSTHDTPRILTLLGTASSSVPAGKDERAAYRLHPAERIVGAARLRLGAVLLYTFPGSPCLYYGDEAGMEGFEDPLNRGTYPWGQEDKAFLRLFTRLGELRRTREALRRGDITYLCAEGGTLAFSRSTEKETVLAAFNTGDAPSELLLPWNGTIATDALRQQQFFVKDHLLHVSLPPLSALLLV